MSTPTKPKSKKTSKPAKSAKERLAAGAKNLQKLRSAEKKNNPVGNPGVIDATNLEVFAPIVKSKDDPKEIMARRVTMTNNGRSFTLDKETTAGEFVSLFDEFKAIGDNWQLRIGRLILEGEKLPCFNGKYTEAMAATRRSLDSCKHYRMVALNIPANLQVLPYTHLREVVKVPELEDKKTIIMEAVEVEKKTGKLPSVKEIRVEADKFKPRKPKKKKAAKAKKDAVEKRDITVEERAAIEEMEGHAALLDSCIQSAAFALELKSDATMILREKLERIARFYGQLTA